MEHLLLQLKNPWKACNNAPASSKGFSTGAPSATTIGTSGCSAHEFPSLARTSFGFLGARRGGMVLIKEYKLRTSLRLFVDVLTFYISIFSH